MLHAQSLSVQSAVSCTRARIRLISTADLDSPHRTAPHGMLVCLHAYNHESDASIMTHPRSASAAAASITWMSTRREGQIAPSMAHAFPSSPSHTFHLKSVERVSERASDEQTETRSVEQEKEHYGCAQGGKRGYDGPIGAPRRAVHLEVTVVVVMGRRSANAKYGREGSCTRYSCSSTVLSNCRT